MHHIRSYCDVDKPKICPSTILESLGLAEGDFVHADQLLAAQEERRVERYRQSFQESGESSSSARSPHDDPLDYKNDLLIIRICPEVGLHRQKFKCVDCDNNINLNNSRLCHYDGRYYCYQCHSGYDMVPIPARIIRNWDFTAKPVSKSSMAKISYIRTRPILINLFQMNPMLYGLVEKLIEIKEIRLRLDSMLKYIEVCGQPNKPSLLDIPSHVQSEEFVNLYSLNDLFDFNKLYNTLLQLQTNLESHIVRQCESCRGKGFYCELCKDYREVLFPFSINGAACPKCKTVYHKNCFHRKKRNCPRCLRIKSRQS